MSRRRKGKQVNGWINFYKPYGMGSTQAVSKIRHLFDAKKSGHAGTLDPLAQGVLPIALGEATKTIAFFQNDVKIYAFKVQWGVETTTCDLEGDVVNRTDKQAKRTEIEAIMPLFIGEIEQVPPAFSAIKVNGERAYDLARAGEEVVLQPRKVTVEWLRLIAHHEEENASDFLVRCQKGTYIRSLARDLGISLGIFGHVTFLERVAVGHFHKDCAISLDKLVEMKDNAALETALLPLETPLDDIPAVIFEEQEVQNLKNGQSVPLNTEKHDLKPLEALKSDLEDSGTIIALARSHSAPIGLIEISEGMARPKRLFNLETE